MDVQKTLLEIIWCEEKSDALSKRASGLRADLQTHMEEFDVNAVKTKEGPAVSLSKPRMYASFNAEDQARVEGWLRRNGVSDIVKRTINKQTLSATVKQLIENGIKIPDTIKMHTKQQLSVRKNGYTTI